MTVKQFRVTKMRTSAVSLVEKGAATGSDAYLVQEAPQLVKDAPETEYPIVALVQEHLGALTEDTDRKAAIEKIVEVLEQDSVAEELADIRAGWPGYELWDAFCSAWWDANSDDEKSLAISQFGEVLLKELITADASADAVAQQGEAKVEAEVEGEAKPEGDITQDAPAEGEATEALTQESIAAMIQAALESIRTELVQAKTDLDAANEKVAEKDQLIEQGKVELAKQKSKNTPTSNQPDADASSVTQSEEETRPNIWQGSHIDAFLKTKFPSLPR